MSGNWTEATRLLVRVEDTRETAEPGATEELLRIATVRAILAVVGALDDLTTILADKHR